MTDPTLTISVSRTSLSLSPLVFSASLDGTALGIVGYQPPGRLARVTYAPDSVDVDGSEPIAASWQQAILGWDWISDLAASETVMQASYATVCAAIGQFSYTVTTQVSGAPAEVWKADRGSINRSPRTYIDLSHPTAVMHAITIPVYPVSA